MNLKMVKMTFLTKSVSTVCNSLLVFSSRKCLVLSVMSYECRSLRKLVQVVCLLLNCSQKLVETINMGC